VNTVIISAEVSSPPTLREAGARTVCNFNIKWEKPVRSLVSHAVFPVTVWGAAANRYASLLKPGTKILISGELNEYERLQSGVPVSAIEIIAKTIELL
jgi:single-stranded DNA-binding protein